MTRSAINMYQVAEVVEQTATKVRAC